MSDLTAYDLAIALADFLELAAMQTVDTSGCEVDRVFVTAGAPALERCREVAVWVSAIGFADVPNQTAGVEQSVCSGSSWVELTWRLTTCISTEDVKGGISEAAHLVDAMCFDATGFGLYQRLMVDPAAALGVADCHSVTAGPFEVFDRSGGRVYGQQVIRVQVDLVRQTS